MKHKNCVSKLIRAELWAEVNDGIFDYISEYETENVVAESEEELNEMMNEFIDRISNKYTVIDSGIEIIDVERLVVYNG